MALPPHFTLSNGMKIPSVGLGTWQSPKGQVRDAVAHALKAGYRHLDCAWGYQNEDEVGEGIRLSGVPRAEIFITSKLFEFHHRHVRQAAEDTIKKLGVGYLDLYLVHWPLAIKPAVPMDGSLPQGPEIDAASGKGIVDLELCENQEPTWREMEKLVDAGLVKSIGISNFNIRRTRELLKFARIKPVANQVELSFTCPQPELLDWLKRHGILPQAYSPLGSTGASQASLDTVDALAKKHGVQGANILISWQVARGANPLPKSVTSERITNNLRLVPLTQEEVSQLEAASRLAPAHKVCDQHHNWATPWDIYEAQHPVNNDVAQAQLD